MLPVSKQIIRTIVTLVTAAIAITCGETPEVIPNNPPGIPPPMIEISDEDRMKALNECAAFVELLGDLRSEVAQEALVEWLKLRPEFDEAGILDKNVWAYFYDGRLAMFIPNWEGAEDDGGRLPMTESSPVTNGKGTRHPTGRTQGLPKTNTVTLFHGLGKAFKEDRKFLADLFAKSNTDYTVELKDASIENLKAVKDLGVFYIRTHGGVGLHKPREDKVGDFGLWTTNPVTEENDKKYEVDLYWHRLVYMHAVNDNSRDSVWRYGITDDFVHEYMTFAENSVQYVDACNSTTLDALDFRERMMKKAANRKATYIGWTAPKSEVEGTPTARYILDRLLGAHDEGVPMEDPIQRPFDLAAIFQDLKSYKLGVSPFGGILTYHTLETSKTILTPSIEYLTMDDFESEMSIKGLFGEDPGAEGIVEVDGVPVPVEWSEELLICHLPDKGPGSSGDVVVSVRGNKSNAVPLSEWIIPVNVSFDQLGMTTEAILNLRVRADVHSYRSKPGESPRPPRGDSLMLIYETVLGRSFGKGSAGTYSVGGTSSVTCPLGICEITDNKTVVAKSGKLPYLETAVGLGFAAYYKWSKDMKKLIVAVDVNIPDVGVEWESTTVCPNIPPAKASHSTATPFGIHNLLDPQSRLEMTLDDNFTIASGTKTQPIGRAPEECRGSVQMEFTAQWSSSVAAFAPNKDTEARHGAVVE